MTDTASPPPPGAISYEQFLRNQIAQPGTICGPDVYDTRPWWQHIPGLNPHAGLERQARAAGRNWAASSRVPGDRARPPEREAEAG